VARRRGGRILAVVGHRALILGFTAFAIFPFYWMLITAFKQNADLYVGASNTAHNPFVFNRPPTLEHLQILFNNTLYLTWLFNTLWVGGLVVATGDIVFADCAGLQSVPASIVDKVPDAVDRMQTQEEQVIAFCRSPQFSIDGLRALVRDLG